MWHVYRVVTILLLVDLLLLVLCSFFDAHKQNTLCAFVLLPRAKVVNKLQHTRL